MKTYVRYDGRGAIEAVIEAPEGYVDTTNTVEIAFNSAVDDLTHYVDLSDKEPVVKRKGPLDTSHAIHGLELAFRALPAGTLIRVERLEGVANGQDDRIDFEVPGTYEIRLSPPPPFLEETLEVTVG